MGLCYNTATKHIQHLGSHLLSAFNTSWSGGELWEVQITNLCQTSAIIMPSLLHYFFHSPPSLLLHRRLLTSDNTSTLLFPTFLNSTCDSTSLFLVVCSILPSFSTVTERSVYNCPLNFILCSYSAWLLSFPLHWSSAHLYMAKGKALCSP